MCAYRAHRQRAGRRLLNVCACVCVCGMRARACETRRNFTRIPFLVPLARYTPTAKLVYNKQLYTRFTHLPNLAQRLLCICCVVTIIFSCRYQVVCRVCSRLPGSRLARPRCLFSCEKRETRRFVPEHNMRLPFRCWSTFTGFAGIWARAHVCRRSYYSLGGRLSRGRTDG